MFFILFSVWFRLLSDPLYVFCLFVILVTYRFGFGSGVLVLIAQVSDHCIRVTFSWPLHDTTAWKLT